MNIFATLMCDEGDAVLIPAPYYGGFDLDLSMRAHVKALPIPCAPPTFRLTVEACEKAYSDAAGKDITVKAIILCNPGNPTGEIIPETLVREYLEWAKSHELQVVMDEIYAFSMLKEETPSESDVYMGEFDAEEDRQTSPFVSILAMKDIPDPARTHFVYGFSKDFCLNG